MYNKRNTSFLVWMDFAEHTEDPVEDPINSAKDGELDVVDWPPALADVDETFKSFLSCASPSLFEVL